MDADLRLIHLLFYASSVFQGEKRTSASVMNRKFIFLLRCKRTKALLFAAVVTNPRPLTE
jgi:hypothetical protein